MTSMTMIGYVMWLFTAAAAPAAAQQTDPFGSLQTAAPADARFEIVISTGDSTRTYRLDKTTGMVWRKEAAPAFTRERFVWRAIPPAEEAIERGAIVNYQLVVSLSTGDALLVNVHTGATWQLRLAGREWEWLPIALEK
jgi:hypothetical protein